MATFTVAGAPVTISQQAGLACSISVTPGTIAFDANGGSSSEAVTAPGGCSWSVSSTGPWITLNGSSYSGSQTVGYAVAANTTTASRTGALTISGLTVTTITQDAPPPCPVNLSKVSESFDWRGNTGSVGLTADARLCLERRQQRTLANRETPVGRREEHHLVLDSQKYELIDSGGHNRGRQPIRRGDTNATLTSLRQVPVGATSSRDDRAHYRCRSRWNVATACLSTTINSIGTSVPSTNRVLERTAICGALRSPVSRRSRARVEHSIVKLRIEASNSR